MYETRHKLYILYLTFKKKMNKRKLTRMCLFKMKRNQLYYTEPICHCTRFRCNKEICLTETSTVLALTPDQSLRSSAAN